MKYNYLLLYRTINILILSDRKIRLLHPSGILKIISFFYNPALYISKKTKARDFTRNLWLLVNLLHNFMFHKPLVQFVINHNRLMLPNRF